MAVAPSVTVVDYGLGNVFSVLRALEQCGAAPQLSGDPDAVATADRLVLPGVGAFGVAADRLTELGLRDAILRFLERERPFLGICLGMQLLMQTGHESGVHPGLGVFPGTVSRLETGAAREGPEGGEPTDAGAPAIRLPFIGWHPLIPGPARHAALPGGGASEAFYFVHSFSARPDDPAVVAAAVGVGQGRAVAAVARDHVLGVQFHPERSGSAGLALLARWVHGGGDGRRSGQGADPSADQSVSPSADEAAGPDGRQDVGEPSRQSGS